MIVAGVALYHLFRGDNGTCRQVHLRGLPEGLLLKQGPTRELRVLEQSVYLVFLVLVLFFPKIFFYSFLGVHFFPFLLLGSQSFLSILPVLVLLIRNVFVFETNFFTFISSFYYFIIQVIL